MRKEQSGYATKRKTDQASRTFTMVLFKRGATQGSCNSTRAEGCSLKGSAQILQLKFDWCGLFNGDGVVLLDDGKEPAHKPDERLVSYRQARQQHWRTKGVTE